MLRILILREFFFLHKSHLHLFTVHCPSVKSPLTKTVRYCTAMAHSHVKESDISVLIAAIQSSVGPIQVKSLNDPDEVAFLDES